MDALDERVRESTERFERIPDLLAEDIEGSLKQGRRSRLANVLSEATADSLEVAVQRRPQAVVQAVYPVIGPAIRRSLREALRQMTDDLDRALGDTFSLRALKWRWEAWRSGLPYAQVVLRHTTRYQVEHLFLTQPESGLLLGHSKAQGLPELDADAIAGMFTAIHQFVRDSVSVGGGDGGIGSATVGDYRLVVSDGPQARLVAFVRGIPSNDFGARLDELNEELHARHAGRLTETPGVGDPDFLNEVQLDDLNDSRSSDEARAYRWLNTPLILAALLLGLIVVQMFLGWRWAVQASEIRDAMTTVPGFALTSFDKTGRGSLAVEGLLDPIAPDPRQLLEQEFPGVQAQWRLRPYVSLDPELIRQRTVRATGLPEQVVAIPTEEGVVVLAGEVSFEDWYRASNLAVVPVGASAIDTKALVFPNKQTVDELVRAIEDVRIAFVSGTVIPEPGAEAALEKMRSNLLELQQLGAAMGMTMRLDTVGATDELGSPQQNRNLRLRRADWLANQLAETLAVPASIVIDQNASTRLPYRDNVRTASVSVTLLPVDP